ncbi:MAG: DICT sensory domain-containing protein, partial [Microcystaceae cyanobacterium]
MNLPSIPELSLYQLTQQVDSPPQSVIVNAATFKFLIGAFFDFLTEQQLTTTIWAKLPRNELWSAQIERYQQQGRADKIYQCSTHKANHASSPVQSALSPHSSAVSQLIPLVLEASSQLQREYFLLVLSPHFCSLMLAQRQPVKLAQEASLTQSQSSQLRLVSSFSPAVIERVLAGIKQVITITDTTPAELLTDADLPFALPSAPNATLISDLLLKQIQYTERIQPTDINAPQSSQTIENLENSLHLKDELLNNLTREMRLPLTNMKTALRLLESKQIKREQRERYLELLHRECDRQSSLLAGLLEFV